jgi:hypothetical protein
MFDTLSLENTSFLRIDNPFPLCYNHRLLLSDITGLVRIFGLVCGFWVVGENCYGFCGFMVVSIVCGLVFVWDFTVALVFLG